MNRLGCIFLSLALAFFMSSSFSMASLVHYSASGSLADNQGTTLQIGGEMYIDDQLRDWGAQIPGQPTEVHEETGLSVYQYYIASYTFNIGQYSFSGNSGWLYLPLERYPTLDNWSTGDLQWMLFEADTDRRYAGWLGENFAFSNLDGTRQDASRYTSLASVIDLGALQTYPYSVLPDMDISSFDLRLTETGAPVPEPATVLLFGAGLLVINLRKIRPRRRYSNI